MDNNKYGLDRNNVPRMPENNGRSSDRAVSYLRQPGSDEPPYVYEFPGCTREYSTKTGRAVHHTDKLLAISSVKERWTLEEKTLLARREPTLLYEHYKQHGKDTRKKIFLNEELQKIVKSGRTTESIKGTKKRLSHKARVTDFYKLKGQQVGDIVSLRDYVNNLEPFTIYEFGAGRLQVLCDRCRTARVSDLAVDLVLYLRETFPSTFRRSHARIPKTSGTMCRKRERQVCVPKLNSSGKRIEANAGKQSLPDRLAM